MAKRGRPPKDKAETTVGEGHNSKTALTEEQRQALHWQHLKSYERALKLKKDADAAFKNACKIIKADGGNVNAIKLTISLQTPEGESAFRARMEMEAEVAKWNGVGVQVDMFSDERQPSVDKARADGKRAGLKGETAKPPHAPETEQFRQWMEGYYEGQSVLTSEGFKKLTPVEQQAAGNA